MKSDIRVLLEVFFFMYDLSQKDWISCEYLVFDCDMFWGAFCVFDVSAFLYALMQFY